MMLLDELQDVFKACLFYWLYKIYHFQYFFIYYFQ